MKKFVTVKDGSTKITINTDYLINVQKISSDMFYVDYYAYDVNKEHPYVIDRVEVSIKSNEYNKLMNDIDDNSVPSC
ncbi:hypothetical protein [Bacteroides cellulosilyticus]|jgi:phosphorylcholine metabolism protein LicD|uniref:hypothetical protein n=1 Tax=Bacteroides cellulosilyticus TaxID=246787 RepID=UPI00189B5F49|nr:hypothetical protein [Bacteroides cellulosilyticus]